MLSILYQRSCPCRANAKSSLLSSRELLALLEAVGLDVPDRSRLDDVVEALARNPEAPVEHLLEALPRKRLKVLCRELGLDDDGRAKAVIVARLLGAEVAEPVRKTTPSRARRRERAAPPVQETLPMVELFEAHGQDVTGAFHVDRDEAHQEFTPDVVEMAEIKRRIDADQWLLAREREMGRALDLMVRGSEGLVASWVQTIATAIDEKSKGGDPFDHKLVRRLLPEYLEEIAEAESKVAKLKLLKKGLPEDLLMGRVRVKVEEEPK